MGKCCGVCYTQSISQSPKKKMEKTVSSIDQRLRDGGREFLYAEFEQRTARALELKDKILVFAVGNPVAKTRRNATAVQVTLSTFWKVLLEQLLYPSHQFRMQYLHPQTSI
jgi:hypothetical protein